MRTFVLLLIPAAMMAQTATSSKDAKPAAKPKPAAAATSGSITIPDDAVEIAPQVYRYTDSKGKKWIYRRTPFGISKLEDRTAEISEAAAAPVPAENRIKVRAIDKGDTVRFEQQTPMGNRVWEKKKEDLTVAEKVLLDSSTKPESSKTAQPEK